MTITVILVTVKIIEEHLASRAQGVLANYGQALKIAVSSWANMASEYTIIAAILTETKRDFGATWEVQQSLSIVTQPSVQVSSPSLTKLVK